MDIATDLDLMAGAVKGDELTGFYALNGSHNGRAGSKLAEQL